MQHLVYIEMNASLQYLIEVDNTLYIKFKLIS